MGLSPLGQYFNSVAQEYKRSFGPPQRIPRPVSNSGYIFIIEYIQVIESGIHGPVRAGPRFLIFSGLWPTDCGDRTEETGRRPIGPWIPKLIIKL